MAGEVLERKTRLIGTWYDDVVSDNIIRYINGVMHVEKGRKVHLKLTREGLKLVKSSTFEGKTVLDVIPLEGIFYITVNQHVTTNMLVITRHKVKKYQIIAFRCQSPVDAGLFVQTFKDFRRRLIEKHKDYNSFLKDRPAVNGNGGILATKRNSEEIIPNGIRVHVFSRNVGTYCSPLLSGGHYGTNLIGFQDVEEHLVEREEVVVDNVTQLNTGTQTPNVTLDDDTSSTSSLSLANELDSLTNELKDMKFMLERSSGIAADDTELNGGVFIDDHVTHATQTIPGNRKRTIDISQESVPISHKVNKVNFRSWNESVNTSDSIKSNSKVIYRASIGPLGGEEENGMVTKQDNHVSWNPTVSVERRSKSLVVRRSGAPLNTFIDKPIETVYPKRPILKNAMYYKPERSASVGRRPQSEIIQSGTVYLSDPKRARFGGSLKHRLVQNGAPPKKVAIKS